MELTIIIFKILLLSKFITSFDPLQWILDILPNKMWKYILVVIATCFKCCSFWIGLIITGDIFIAAGASYLAYLYTSIEQNIIRTIWQRNNL